MPPSTIHPDGPLARAIELLEEQDCHEEVAEIRRLLVERIQYREMAAMSREAVDLLEKELSKFK